MQCLRQSSRTDYCKDDVDVGCSFYIGCCCDECNVCIRAPKIEIKYVIVAMRRIVNDTSEGREGVEGEKNRLEKGNEKKGDAL